MFLFYGRPRLNAKVRLGVVGGSGCNQVLPSSSRHCAFHLNAHGRHSTHTVVATETASGAERARLKLSATSATNSITEFERVKFGHIVNLPIERGGPVRCIYMYPAWLTVFTSLPTELHFQRLLSAVDVQLSFISLTTACYAQNPASAVVHMREHPGMGIHPKRFCRISACHFRGPLRK